MDVLSSTVPVGTWNIDPSHSEIGFTARHLMSKVRGQFEKFEGKIVTGDAPSATVTVDLNSINTREENRDAHLRSGDFFDVEKNGPMTFTSTQVDAGGRGLLVTGDLSLKGVTKAVTLDVEVLGSEGDPWGGTRVGFEGTTSISRKDFGVDFNIPLDGGRLMIGDKIDIIIGIEAVLEQDQAPTA
ncbi:YceI family protein [Nocardioides panacis]|uniref:YceI family protein n=1 Tax=Nocardioides panacis TaxID=2849501 RepID=A0A975T415_9ACTN|nr:YceI family protein [Nocardioides panacis]